MAMVNVAGYEALRDAMGTRWAATVVAAVDFVVAALVLLVAGNSRPGPELDVVFDVWKMALDSIQADARDVKLALDALGHEVQSIKATMRQLVHNPLDIAAQKVLIPASLSIIRGLRAKTAP